MENEDQASTPNSAAETVENIEVSPQTFTAEEWKTVLVPDEFKDMPVVQNAKTPKDIFNRLGYLDSKVGRSIAIPGKDATHEDWTEFHQKVQNKIPGLLELPEPDDIPGFESLYNKLGRPEDTSGYENPSFEGTEGVEFDQAVMDRFKPIAHKFGLSKKQYKGIVEEYLGEDLEKATQAYATHKEQISELHKEWGAAAEHKTQKAAAIAKEFFPNTNLANLIKDQKIDAGTLKDLVNIGSRLGEEGQQLVGEQNTRGVSTPDELRDKAQELAIKIYSMPPGEQRERLIHKRISILEAASRNT